MSYRLALALMLLGAPARAADDPIARGRELAFDPEKGNCLTCHAIAGARVFGDVGPPLADIKERYDRSALRAQIWDATAANPESLMPPYGRHGILTESEIDMITKFVWSL